MRAFGHGAAECIDTELELVDRIAASTYREVVDLVGQRLHLGRQVAYGLIGSNMRGHLAQRANRSLELLHRRRVFLGDDEIDLVGKRVDCVGISDQIFRWRQFAQRIAHFGKPMLDPGEGAAVDAGLSAFRDTLGQVLNLPLDSFDGPTRHRLIERAADLAKLRA